MRITRIELEGREGRYATITRRRGSQWIEITILTPDQPNGTDRRIAADAAEDKLWNQARDLHYAVEGCHGSNSDIHDYYCELQRFAD